MRIRFMSLNTVIVFSMIALIAFLGRGAYFQQPTLR